MSIFTKSINNISFDDIEAFCKTGVEEGIRVEYKREFPDNRKIAKEIAAFANTHGGLLIIGVDEEAKIPKLPITGIDYKTDHNEKISSICLKSINPPLFPEIKVCQFLSDPEKAIILVRVHESDETPHRIDQDTKTYIRIASQSEPVDAPFGEIEWLMNRREKAVKNRERLLQRAEERFKNKTRTEKNPFRGISIVPLYPHTEIVSYDKICEVAKNAALTGYNPSDAFPINIQNPITLKESIIFCSRFDEEYFPYTEVNSFGLIFHKEKLFEDTTTEHSKNKIDILFSLEKMHLAILFAKKFYEQAGYRGLIRIHIFFENILGRGLCKNFCDFGNIYQNDYDKKLTFEDIVSISEIHENFEKILLDIYKEFLWSLNLKGMALNNKILTGYLNEVKQSLKIRGFLI